MRAGRSSTSESWKDDVVGVAGWWSDYGWEAVQLASEHPEIERLVLLATPVDKDKDAKVPEIAAKALLLFGAKDERANSRAARWWKERIPQARMEISPGLGHDLLAPCWPRTLSHLAPGTLR
jgi:pimeloyl-ACP methyl ester carboxylesterase